MVFNSIGLTPESVESILGWALKPSIAGHFETLVPGVVTWVDPRLFLKVQRN
jgi:hypothetical protein